MAQNKIRREGKRSFLGDIMTVEDAKKKISSFWKPSLKKTKISIWKASGRISGEDFVANIDVPPFNRSVYDGYAVRAQDTFEAEEDSPINLRIVGSISAGEVPKINVEEGECAEIATGAIIPRGANAVVMVEYTEVEKDNIMIYKPVSVSQNIFSAGADIAAGELILREGDLIDIRKVGVLSAIGISEVLVYEKPKVAIISTGNEISEVGKPLEQGYIYDINAPTLFNAVREDGGEPKYFGIVEDDPNLLTEKIKEALAESDIILSSGGTSKGAGDISLETVSKLGKPGLLFHGIKMKPGKPLACFVINEKIVFCLPGYPTSALMTYKIFVSPLLRMLAGYSSPVHSLFATLSMEVRNSGGRNYLLPVSLIKRKSGLIAYPILKGSGAITTLDLASGFVNIPGDIQYLDEGEKVKINLFQKEVDFPDIVFMGSNCVGVELIYKMMRNQSDFKMKIFNVGSMAGLRAIKRKDADLAGMHLLDSETGEYNIPFIKKYKLNDVVLVKGYKREIGLIVEKGNPKNITKIEDFR